MKLEKERFRKILGLVLIVMLAYSQQYSCQVQYYWQKAKCQYSHWVSDIQEDDKEETKQELTKTIVKIIL